ncbi:MAG: hypothetical protein ACLR0N_14025 [Bilophila wadsworthia]
MHEFGDFLDVDSNRPSVFGFVIMIPAQSSSIRAATSSTVRMPSGPSGTFTDEKPHRAALAGLVPCAVSGMSILVRVLPCARCHA